MAAAAAADFEQQELLLMREIISEKPQGTGIRTITSLLNMKEREREVGKKEEKKGRQDGGVVVYAIDVSFIFFF